MEERKYVVYVHINKTNLKVYVGQTGQSLQRRWRNGRGYLNCKTYFSNAIKKYGFSQSHIGAVCRGQRNTCGKHPETKENLHWLFLNDAIEQGYVATL